MIGAEILYLDSIPSIVGSIQTKFPVYQYLILTDEFISKIHLEKFESEMKAKNMRFFTYILPSGELNKSAKSIEKVQDFMFANHFSRNDMLIAFGGGLITDFGGFVSSIYMRGITFVNIPTSLLGMVDASVGGKTAINTKFGKNLIGAFYDAKVIYINVNFLKSIDDRNFHNGFGEIIKAALLFDQELFEKLEKCNVRDLKEKNEKELESIIKRSIDIKLYFVLKDKKESHLRKLLNLGHTIGHGIEYALHEELLHGECLSIGMMKMLEIGIRKNIIEEDKGFEITHRLKNLLEKFHLPTKVPSNVNLKHVLLNMMSDKKNEAQEIRFVFIKDIGVFHEKSVAVEIPLIMEVLSNKISPISCVPPPQDNPLELDTVGSKSITNRLLLMASLGEGEIQIQNFLRAEDTKVLLDALKKLDLCEISELKEKNLKIKGTGGAFRKRASSEEITIDIVNSGLSARFLACLLSFIPGVFILTGNDHMKKRPIGDLIKAVKSNTDCEYFYLEENGCLPIKIVNNKKNCGLKGGKINLNPKISSQYVTALLLCAPYADNPVTVHLEDIREEKDIISKQYIEMTLKLMKIFGIEVKKIAFNEFSIPSGTYKNPITYEVEPDFTTISNDLAFVSLFGGITKIKKFHKEILQTDAFFPSEVLTKIGLEVETLPNNEILIKRDLNKQLVPINVNMSKFTDCFMAFAVIASQINGVTVITGISNQRFKECNRIKMVCKNLIKCGIFCKENPDGITIYGRDQTKTRIDEVKRTILIETNEDHRISMAFTILAAYYSHVQHPLRLLIDDKNCVSKTFPEYFLHLNRTYGMNFQGEHLWDSKTEDFENEGACKTFSNPKYLIIIGMKSVGKSYVSQLISKNFQWKTFSLDDIVLHRFQEKKSSLTSLKDVIEEYGWKRFRAVEKAVFFEYIQKTVEGELKNCVICTGGGVIEDENNVQLLRMMDNVIWIENSFTEEIEKNASKPKYENETFMEVYNRRKTTYNSTAKHILCYPGFNYVKEPNQYVYYEQLEKMRNLQLEYILGNSYKYIIKEDTFFLCLSLEATDQLKKEDFYYIESNYNALEITISDFVVSFMNNDLINPTNEKLESLVEQLRHRISRSFYFLTSSNIIITLRTEGRKFEMSDKTYNYILNELRRSFFNLTFDLEFRAKNISFLNNFVEQHSNIIISKHFFDENVTEDDVMKEFERMYAFSEYNASSIKLFKMVLSASTSSILLENIRDRASSLPLPNLIIKLGKEGKYSRLQSKVYLPVYDSLLMQSVIVGQIQKSEAINLRKELYLDSDYYKKFYILGKNSDHSKSPKFHLQRFKSLGLFDHFYSHRNVEDEKMLLAILKEKDFTGASITFPFKKTVVKYLDFLVDEAKEIGVVNTVMKCQGKFYGFNTDWYGIYHAFKKKFLDVNSKTLGKRTDSKKYALILGAGATCESGAYVFSKIMNLEVLIFNRSDHRFKDLESKKLKRDHMFTDHKEFEKFFNEELKNKNGEIVCVLSTVPCINDQNFLLNKISPEVLKEVFHTNCFVCNVNYHHSANIGDFENHVTSFNACHIISGIEMFLYQAQLQSEIISGKDCSYREMRDFSLN